ncbi:MAG: hypothetical protein LC800_14425, partial [Acidobacteria bacterium]|nr:hypothetical protein [Acidobacteriota bacterium]
NFSYAGGMKSYLDRQPPLCPSARQRSPGLLVTRAEGRRPRGHSARRRVALTTNVKELMSEMIFSKRMAVGSAKRCAGCIGGVNRPP